MNFATNPPVIKHTDISLRSRTLPLAVRLEKIFVTVVLFLLSGALLPVLLPVLRPQASVYTSTEFGTDPLVSGIWIGIYTIIFMLSLMRLSSIYVLLINERFVLLLVGLAAASALRSYEQSLTLRRIFSLLGATSFGLYLGARFTLREWLRLLGWSLVLAAVLSLIFALFFPTLGLYEGIWRGVFIHKNSLGRIMTLAIMTVLLLHFPHRQRILKYLLLALVGVLLIFSTSASAIVTSLALISLIPIFHILRRRLNLVLMLALVLITAGTGFGMLWLEQGTETALNLLGRNMTLTGRDVLWRALIPIIQERPWLGYGYSAFWLGWAGESARVWAQIGWFPPHAHNGFLDLCLQLGLVGLSTYLIGLLQAMRNAIKLLREQAALETIWPISFLVFMIIYNVTESAILNNLFWALYVSTVCSILPGVSIKDKEKQRWYSK